MLPEGPKWRRPLAPESGAPEEPFGGKAPLKAKRIGVLEQKVPGDVKAVLEDGGISVPLGGVVVDAESVGENREHVNVVAVLKFQQANGTVTE